ncbi:MAG: two-component regulator propeller domain-containing protein, partial [Bacteroidota bacterium]
MNKGTWLILIGWFGWGLLYYGAQAQPIAAFNITIEDGLPSNTVYDLYQDTQGQVWVATESGLAQYNGADFTYYPGKGLKSLAVSGLREDAEGGLWLVNFYGQVLYLEQDTLRPLLAWDTLNLSGYPAILAREDAIDIMDNRKAWYRYFPKDQELILFDSLAPGISLMPEIVHQELWAFWDLDVVRLIPPDPDSLTHFQFDFPLKGGVPRLAAVGEQRLLFPYDMRKGFLWDSIQGWRSFPNDFIPEETGIRYAVALTDTSAALVSSQGLGLVFSPDSVLFLLEGENISSVIALQEGGLLVGTLDKGLWLIPNLEVLAFPSLTGRQYYRIAYDQKGDCIIIGDRGGALHFFDTQGRVTRPGTEMIISEVQALFLDSLNHKLYFQTDRLHGLELGSADLPYVFNELNTAKDMVRVDDEYYLATSYGLHRLGLEGRFLGSHSNLRMSRLMVLNDHQLLVSAQSGLLLFDIPSQSFVTEQLPWEVIPESPTEFAKQGDFTLIGTAYQGLYIFKQSTLWWHLTEEEGLLSNHISALDLRGDNVAVGSNKGAHIIHLPSRSIRTLDRAKGLLSSEVADLVLTEEHLWVANLYGLQRFPRQLGAKAKVPEIHLKSVALDGEPILHPESLRLPYDHQELRLSFDVTQVVLSQGKSQIYYRIPALNGSRWNVTDLSQPTATYLSLNSGTYVVEAYAQMEEGQVSSMMQIPLTVVTPYWQRWWFLALCLLLGAGLVALLV